MRFLLFIIAFICCSVNGMAQSDSVMLIYLFTPYDMDLYQIS